MTVTGDRSRFLNRLRERLVGEVPGNPAHPRPPPVDEVPRIGYRTVDPDDLLGSFVSAAAAAGAVVHCGEGALLTDQFLTALIARHDVRRAVLSSEPAALALAGPLGRLGVTIEASATPEAAARADLGVTSAVALIAATGTVVLDAGLMRTRSASLLPPVHLCVAPTRLVVRSPSEVLRPLTGQPDRLPSNLVFVTGPSRTGDIEQLLTIGVHGPTVVEIVLVEP